MTVIVGYTPTEEGRAALSHGVEAALVRAQPMLVLDITGGRRLHGGDAPSARKFAELSEDLSGSGVHFELRASPADALSVEDALLDAVEDVNLDVIVLGIRRRSPAGKFLLGSRAQRLILAAECPVVLVKAPGTESR